MTHTILSVTIVTESLSVVQRYQQDQTIKSGKKFCLADINRQDFFLRIKMTFKAEIMDSVAVERSLIRISHEIIEKNHGADNVILVGILRRGVSLAKKIAYYIKKHENVDVPIGVVDITRYRDDLSIKEPDTIEKNTTLPVSPNDKVVILVDDVLYTGRTARAAMEAVIARGRPAAIQLAVLVDRGHRELPIRGDFVGKNLPTSKNEMVSVCVEEYDDKVCVELYDIKN